MIRRKNFVGIFVVLVLFLSLSACGKTPIETGNGTPAKENGLKGQVKLTVSAAASLKDAMNELKEAYKKESPEVMITYNFGSTGSLKQQIENGAEVDLFLSAAQAQMDALNEKGLLEEETRRNLLGNTLVLIVPNSSSLRVDFESLGTDEIKKLALGEPKSVPVGQYAEEVFQKLNIQEKIRNKAIYGKDVREVLAWVETGNADAGVVYETDAKGSKKVKVMAKAPEAAHRPIVYPASVLKGSKNKEAAKKFLNFISEGKGKTVFEKFGFKFLEKA